MDYKVLAVLFVLMFLGMSYSQIFAFGCIFYVYTKFARRGPAVQEGVVLGPASQSEPVGATASTIPRAADSKTE